MGSAEFHAEIRTKLQRAEEQAGRFGLLGADHKAVVETRLELWEDRLRALAEAFGIQLDTLPRKKSATEKLTLAAAMKQTTSVSKAWLAQRLQMGVADSLGPLLHRFRASGGTTQPAFRAVMSRFLS